MNYTYCPSRIYIFPVLKICHRSMSLKATELYRGSNLKGKLPLDMNTDAHAQPQNQDSHYKYWPRINISPVLKMSSRSVHINTHKKRNRQQHNTSNRDRTVRRLELNAERAPPCLIFAPNLACCLHSTERACTELCSPLPSLIVRLPQTLRAARMHFAYKNPLLML